MGSRRLTAWAMARPIHYFSFPYSLPFGHKNKLYCFPRCDKSSHVSLSIIIAYKPRLNFKIINFGEGGSAAFIPEDMTVTSLYCFLQNFCSGFYCNRELIDFVIDLYSLHTAFSANVRFDFKSTENATPMSLVVKVGIQLYMWVGAVNTSKRMPTGSNREGPGITQLI
jgi:hypothetical protein